MHVFSDMLKVAARLGVREEERIMLQSYWVQDKK